MKRLMLALPIVGILLMLTACRWSDMPAEEVYERLDGLAHDIASAQITEETDLIGQRTNGDDDYTGTYVCDCIHASGRDVVFGGASIKERKLRLSGSVKHSDGNADIRIRMNDEVIYLECDASGMFEEILDLTTGGNFIMVDYDDFTGQITMDCAYVD